MISNNAGDGIQITGVGNGIDASAIAWFRAENDFTDATGQNNGTDIGGVTFAAGVAGGQAFQLDGATQFVEVADGPSIEISDTLTVEGWINPISAPGFFDAIASKYNSQGNQIGWAFFWGANGQLRLQVSQDGSTAGSRIVETTGVSIPLNQFTHVAASFDAATQDIQIYVNGEAQPTTFIQNTTVTSIADTTAPLRIGAYRQNSGNLTGHVEGLLDEVAVYDSVLHPVQIAAIHEMAGAGKQGAVIEGNIIGIGNVRSEGEAGVVAYYRADGSVVDTVGGNNGSLENGANYAQGFIGDSFEFNGVQERARIPNDASLEPSSSITVEAWVNSTSAGTFDYILTKGEETGQFGSYSFYTSGTGGLIFYVTTTSNGLVLSDDAGTGIWDGEWHHVVGTYDGTQVRLFVDGMEAGTANPQSGPIRYGLDATNDLLLGSFETTVTSIPGTTYDFPGRVDEVAIFDRALTPAEIASNYSAATTGIDLGNNTSGILLDNSAGNVIGGDSAATRNIISSNDETGIRISGSAAVGNIVQGNYFGTDATGTVDLGNTFAGIDIINGAGQTLIGGNGTVGEGNVIAGSGFDGIVLGSSTSSSTNNIIQGNLIGLNAAGTAAIGNRDGIVTWPGASDNQIGGVSTDFASLLFVDDFEDLAANADASSRSIAGVNITITPDSGLPITARTYNDAGTEAFVSGVTPNLPAVPANVSGVRFISTVVPGSHDFKQAEPMEFALSKPVRGFGFTTLDLLETGTLPGESVTVTAYDAAGNVVDSQTRTAPVIATADGVDFDWFVSSANDDIIRVVLSGDLTTLTGYGIDDLVVQPKPEIGNIISGNNGAGVVLSGVGTDNNTLEGNIIGLNLAGDTAIANTASGVVIEGGATNNTIGGSAAAARNIIAANDGSGVTIDGADNNRVEGNYVGVSANGSGIINGTLALWTMDGATVTDVVGNNDPSLQTGLTFAPGINGDAVDTESAGFIEVPEGSLTPSQITLDAWARPDGPGTNEDAFGSVVILKRFTNSNTLGILWRASDERFVFTFGEIATDFVLSSNSFPVGSFYHVAATYDGTTAKLYVDGQLEGQATGSALQYNGTSPWTIGAASQLIAGMGFARRFNGAIDDVGLYDRPLEQSEIDAIVQSGSKGKEGYFGNVGSGVAIVNAAVGNTIGGTIVGAGNVISGNNGAGVILNGTGTDNNTLEGNIIGLNLAGDTAIANTDSGVVIEGGATNNTIGGSTAAARNVISGNTVDGIRLDGAGTGNQIAGNYIGSNSAGDASLANGTVGVHLLNASHGTVIGTNGDGIGDAGEGNLITGQGSGDIGVSINDSDNTIVAGNIIGLNAAGDTALFAALNQRGVRIEDSIGTRIGTDADGTSDTEERNVIAGQRGNQGIGIEIRSGTSATKIAGNYLGTDITGTVAIVTGGVNRTGVFINENGGGAVIGGSTPAERNIIGGQQHGISFRLGSNNKVQGNYIGIGADGDTVVGNTYGYWAQDPSNFNIIGTDGDGVNDATEGNVISGNQTGVHTFGGFGVVIAGNIVGLDPTGDRCQTEHDRWSGHPHL